MSKRARTKRSNGSRTGGTGDIKPQILTINSGLPTLNKYVVTQVALPVPRFGSQAGRTTVIELLSLDWYIGVLDLADAAHTHWAYLTTGTDRVSGAASLLVDMNVDIVDPLTFGLACTGQANTAAPMPQHIDFTDNNGNGMVIATDKIFIVNGSVGGTIAAGSVCKFKYRLVNIGMREYIGIVQSQQV